MMRRVGVLLGLAVVAQATPLSARVRPVVEAGVHVSTIDYDQQPGYWRNGWRSSFTAGASVEIPLGARFRLAPGLRYVQKGNRVRYDVFGTAGQFRIAQDYLALPLTLQVTPFRSSAVALSIGPEVGILVSAQTLIEPGPLYYTGYYDDIRDDLESIDVALDVGVEYAFPIENHEGLVRFRYSHGLTGVAREGHWITDWTTRGLQGTLGLRW
jgi:hypothetical protein